ncbi:cytochrome P450 78A9-like [Ananas comosus]|uniref:Cytochrome P450 78A9-like n=1 Tax=Ananas comosus TaxID=4615 RepID=A0A6P5FGG8_ANACO|nr:cytochrome P450 78A9-like [Ananas comosus]
MKSSLKSFLVPLLTLAPLAISRSPNTLCSTAILILLAWRLTTSLLHWLHPGGHAWGKYVSYRACERSSRSIIPGPRGVPFVGSMRLMSGLAHRRLDAVARCLGAKRLMAISLGDTRAVVASHPDVAKEILNGPSFSDRPHNHSAYGLMFHRSIGFAPYGAYWRTLRHIAASHLFSPRQIEASASHRLHVATEVVSALRQLAIARKAVEIRGLLKRASLFFIMRSVFGKKYELSTEAEAEVEELLGMVDEGYDLLGKRNWCDYFPLLAGLDLQHIQSRCSKLMPKVNRYVNSIIDEHRSTAGTETERSDFVAVLLSLQQSEGLSDADIAAVLWEMIFRGTDATAVLMEWALARLVLHPDVQAKVHAELDEVVGRSTPVNESHVPKLVYLQAVLKEVLRMHPPGPLLAWVRQATLDAEVDGHSVPAGTAAVVNMWAITHDADVWPEPFEFRPERFLAAGAGADVVDQFSVLGGDARLAPFGSGKRSCPGKAMAMTAVGFWLATLLHEYEWASPSDAPSVDLSEVLRLSCEMAVPLEVVVRPRRVI